MSILSLFFKRIVYSTRVRSGGIFAFVAGLGYLIVYGGQVFKLDLVMASVIILALISAIMYQAVVIVEKAVQKTHKFV